MICPHRKACMLAPLTAPCHAQGLVSWCHLHWWQRVHRNKWCSESPKHHGASRTLLWKFFYSESIDIRYQETKTVPCVGVGGKPCLDSLPDELLWLMVTCKLWVAVDKWDLVSLLHCPSLGARGLQGHLAGTLYMYLGPGREQRASSQFVGAVSCWGRGAGWGGAGGALTPGRPAPTCAVARPPARHAAAKGSFHASVVLSLACWITVEYGKVELYFHRNLCPSNVIWNSKFCEWLLKP